MTTSTNPASTSCDVLRLIVSVADLDRALTFYAGVLGLVVRARHGDFAWLDVPAGPELMLHRRTVHRGDAAVAIGFQVVRLADAVAQWQRLGGVVIDPPAAQPWGESMAVVRDPDGHVVCLSERVPPVEPSTGADEITSLTNEIFLLSDALTRAGDAIVAPLGLSAARWLILGALVDQPLTVAEIARRRGLRRQSVRESAARLERDQLIQRVPDASDRRAPQLHLTARGRAALRAIEPRRRAWATELAATVDPGQIGAAVVLARRLRQRLEPSEHP